MRCVRPFCLAGLAVAILSAAAAAGDLPAYQPIEPSQYPQDRPPIVWAQDFDAMYKANTQQWAKDLEAQEKDGRRRSARMQYRTVYLLEALAEKYADQSAVRLKCFSEIAATLENMGYPLRACHFRKLILDEFPGRMSVAAGQLNAILQIREYNQDPAGCRAWLTYAADRLLAMNRGELLPDGHPFVINALVMRTRQRIGERRYSDATELIEEIRRRGGDEYWIVATEGQIAALCGRRDEAIRRYERAEALMPAGSHRDILAGLKAQAESPPPTFDRALALETHWENLRADTGGATADTVLPLVKEAADSAGLTRLSPDCWGSVWRGLDEMLRGQSAETRKALSAAADQAANAQTPPKADDYAQALVFFRRYPWSAAAQQAMLQAGQQALREGKTGWAVAAFRDVIDHAQDVKLIQSAKALLALAGTAEATQPPAALASLDRLPLRALSPSVSPWPMEAFEPMPAWILAGSPLPHGQLQPAGDDLLLSGPNLLACFDHAGRRRWQQFYPLADGPTLGYPSEWPVPGNFLPAVGEGLIVTRWAMDDAAQQSLAVAAFRQATGQLVWSTSNSEPLWRGLMPISDPTIADGRVYVMAVSPGGISTTFLFCFDLHTGGLTWRRAIGSQSPLLPTGDNYYFRNNRALNLVGYGNAVTVRDGSVYCSTNQGMLARLDARDGLPLWVRTYERAGLQHDPPGFVARLGAAPLVCGDKVIFMPRDNSGLMALDAATGRVMWDNALVGSDEMVGVDGPRIIVRGGSTISAVDQADGKLLWHTGLEDGVVGSPRLTAGGVLVSTARRLCLLSAGDGLLRQERPWGDQPPARQMLPLDDALAVVAIGGSGAAGIVAHPEVKPDLSAAQPRWPMREAWTLPRRDGQMFSFPAPDGQCDFVFLYSEGVLERIDLPAGGKVAWRHYAGPQLLGVDLAGGVVVVEYASRVVGLEQATGKQLWDIAVPIDMQQYRVCGKYIVGAFFPPGQYKGISAAAVIDPAAGKLLWASNFSNMFDLNSGGYFTGMSFDGQKLHFLWPVSPTAPGAADVSIDIATGKLLGVTAIAEKVNFLKAFDDGLVYWDKDYKLHRVIYQAGGSKTVDFKTPLQADSDPFRFSRAQRDGAWMMFQYWHRDLPLVYLYNLDDPADAQQIRGDSYLEGGLLYTRVNNSVVCRDPKTHKLTAFPVSYEDFIPGGFMPLKTMRQGQSLLAFFGAMYTDYPRVYPTFLRLEAFDAQTGRRMWSQGLKGTEYWIQQAGKDLNTRRELNRFALCKGVLAVTDSQGLHVYAPAEADAAENTIAYRAPAAVRLDGDLGEWEPQAAIGVPAPAGAGKVQLAYDDENLYLAVTAPAAEASPKRGSSQCPGGGWLEVAIGHGVRFSAGLNGDGQFVCEGFADGQAPAGAAGAVRHDLAAGTVTYELALPRKTIGELAPGYLSMSLAVWADSPDGGQRPLLQWGGGLGSVGVGDYSQRNVRCAPATIAQTRAALALAHKTIELNYSAELIRQDLLQRGGSGESLIAPCTAFFKAHPQSWQCLRIMTMLDNAWRADWRDPTAEVLKLAESAGVAAPVRDAYARIAKSYLSAWVYLEQPCNLVNFRLAEGDQWSKRIFWNGFEIYGSPNDTFIVPPPVIYAGGAPAGSWVELRAPLIQLDWYTRPITAIAFGHRPAKSYIDRLSLFIDGKEQVLFAGDLGKNKLASGRLGDRPSRSGGKNLTLDATSAYYYGDLTLSLATPITEHIVKPPAATLDQKELAAVIMPELSRLSPPAAYDFFKAVLALEKPGPQNLEYYKAFARACPNNPKVGEAISAVVGLASTDWTKGQAAASALVDELPLDIKAKYALRRHYAGFTRSYIVRWQGLGPLPAAGLGLEKKPIDLDRQYEGLSGQVRWQTLSADGDCIVRLAKSFEPAGETTGYAVCWVHSPKATAAVLELSFGHKGTAFVNGEQVFSGQTPGGFDSPPTPTLGDVSLKEGWNTLLLRVDSGPLPKPQPGKPAPQPTWFFKAELVEPNGTGRGEMKIYHQPPDATSGPTTAPS